MYLKNYLRKAIENRNQYIIQKLIQFDIYKIRHKHLYELTLTELEEEYEKIINQKEPIQTTG